MRIKKQETLLTIHEHDDDDNDDDAALPYKIFLEYMKYFTPILALPSLASLRHLNARRD